MKVDFGAITLFHLYFEGFDPDRMTPAVTAVNRMPDLQGRAKGEKHSKRRESCCGSISGYHPVKTIPVACLVFLVLRTDTGGAASYAGDPRPIISRARLMN